MATQMMTQYLTRTDRRVAWTLIADLMPALVQYAQDWALPVHFV